MFKPTAIVLGALVAIVGLAVLAGWALGIPALKSVVVGMATMKANTAITFVLLGGCLVLHAVCAYSKEDRRGLKRTCVFFGSGAFLLSLLTLSEDLFGTNLGIDELFFADRNSPHALFHGRMSTGTSSCFVLLAASLLVAQAFGG
ncbi:MAG: hypothetical protein JST12_05430 [Armatimonadetes bacterium]|nr:hypothetical protein [Armatimonadota bacterium]